MMGPIAAELDWYAVQVTSGREMRVADRLREIGVAHYLPITRVRVRSGRSKTAVLRVRLLMPGWLLVGFPDRALRFDVVAAVPFVQGFAGQDRPVRIAPGVAGSFMALHEQWLGEAAEAMGRRRRLMEAERQAERRARVQVGMVAKVAVGAFGDVDVRVISVGAREARCVAFLFGSERSVSVNLDALAHAGG